MAALQLVALPDLPRAPASIVCDTTFLSGGSAMNTLGSLHGAPASAHVSSTGEGARMPSLFETYAVNPADGLKLTPSAGEKRAKTCSPLSPGFWPPRSSIRTRARL